MKENNDEVVIKIPTIECKSWAEYNIYSTAKFAIEHPEKFVEICEELIEEVGYYLGTGIANLVSILDPEIVIVGGGVSNAGEILFSRARNTVQRRLYTRNQLDIVCAELGDKGGILGSALYAKLF